MNMIRKGQLKRIARNDVIGQAKFIESLFNVVEAESPDAVWNSEQAQEIRRSVLDGDYSYCSRTMCPAIVNNALPRSEDVTAPRLRRIIERRETVLEDGPLTVCYRYTGKKPNRNRLERLPCLVHRKNSE